MGADLDGFGQCARRDPGVGARDRSTTQPD
ncbi:MAG: hypothetical protein RI904_1234, partial [Pseudomonadota bacterium]